MAGAGPGRRSASVGNGGAPALANCNLKFGKKFDKKEFGRSISNYLQVTGFVLIGFYIMLFFSQPFGRVYFV